MILVRVILGALITVLVALAGFALIWFATVPQQVPSLLRLTFVFTLIPLMAGYLGGMAFIFPAIARMWQRSRLSFRQRLQTKLMVSHVAVVILSLLVFAFLGFLLYLITTANTDLSTTIDDQLQAILSLTAFTLVMIAVITACSIMVALFASKYLANRLTRQIMELERVTELMAAGQLDQRVAQLSHDELGDLAVRFNAFAGRLEELDQQRRAFVANVSHDLRTPIAIIRGHVDAQLREVDEHTASPEEAFRTIEHEVMTLSALVDDLFTLSRLEEGALPIALYAVDLEPVVRDAVVGVRPYALKHARVSTNYEVAEGLPRVMADETRLTQILNNLLQNGIRHTPEGGIVMVNAAAADDGMSVRIDVIDTGVGMSAEQKARIFERFYQGESRREGGAGLGLSIVKQLVDALHGTIDVESEEGVGTTFSIVLQSASAVAKK